MRVGIIPVFVDYHRGGSHNRGVLQPQIGPLIAGLLPRSVDIEIVNDAWTDPDWGKDYDLLFISSLHSDFDRARQISHYWRRRGAKTVYGGTFASTYPSLCRPFFDAIVVGDPEPSVPLIYEDFLGNQLKSLYVSEPYDANRVPLPRFDLQAEQQLLPISLEATRGCPFTCDFCALTGIGTRHHVRPVDTVVRDIRAGQDMLRDHIPWHESYRLNNVVFLDNNIGGNPKFLLDLTEKISDLDIGWGSSATFNVVSNPQIVRKLSQSGCRFLFVGLESFNPAAISDMRKHQNVISDIERVLQACHMNGILIVSGLMINPIVDDVDYIKAIPLHLKRSGLYVPSFVSFESPIPGTPHFRSLASKEEPAFLPNALLRDFTGYTLVTKPVAAQADAFVDAYRRLLSSVFSSKSLVAKSMHDLRRFLPRGYWDTAIVDIASLRGFQRDNPERTYLAGTDTPPPEAANVPFSDDDFESECERDLILNPWRVTDRTGRVLPEWLNPTKVFAAKGKITEDARRMIEA